MMTDFFRIPHTHNNEFIELWYAHWYHDFDFINCAMDRNVEMAILNKEFYKGIMDIIYMGEWNVILNSICLALDRDGLKLANEYCHNLNSELF